MNSPSRAASALTLWGPISFLAAPLGSLGQLCKRVPRGISEVWDQKVERQDTEFKRLSRMSGWGAGLEISGFADLQNHSLMSPGKLQNEN